MINKSEPNMDPCGTPVEKCNMSEFDLTFSTYCVLFDK